MKEANVSQRKRLFFDLALILCLLLFAIIASLIVGKASETGSGVRISIAGKFVAEYPLDKDGEYSLNDGTNILLIKDGEASVIYADCPDKICKRTGPISLVGEYIVCLPNKLMIEIVGEGDVDFVS